MSGTMLSLDETNLERRSLARNEFLFKQGDKVEAIYFIEEGRLRLDRQSQGSLDFVRFGPPAVPFCHLQLRPVG